MEHEGGGKALNQESEERRGFWGHEESEGSQSITGI